MMYIILCYDVRSQRTGRMLKTARKYLHSTQRSVLEGHLTHAQAARLKEEIAKIIDPEEDSVRIFAVDSAKLLKIDEIGRDSASLDSFL